MTKISKQISSFTKQEVTHLFEHARCVFKNDRLTVLAAPKLLATHGRILVITSQKVGSAPVRNKIRRQLKALFYQEKIYARGYDYIVIVKPNLKPYTFDALKDMFAKITAAISP